MELITQEQLKSLHTQHRTSYRLEYIDHLVILQDGCRGCYEQICICKPRWLLKVWFYCSWCDKKRWSPRTLYIQELEPTLDQFFSEPE